MLLLILVKFNSKSKKELLKITRQLEKEEEQFGL